MQGIGKIFEQQLSCSVPEYVLWYRLHDPAQAFGGGDKSRFSLKNPFDILMWDSHRRILYAIEAKTASGESISFERIKTDKGMIHLHQIEGLNKWNAYPGVVCGLFIEFRKLEKTIFLDIESMNKIMDAIPKKSFSIKDLDKNNIPYFVIPQSKKRTRHTYDLDCFLSRNDNLGNRTKGENYGTGKSYGN